jgi:hypothetical protein
MPQRVTSQDTVIFIFSAVKTSGLTKLQLVFNRDITDGIIVYITDHYAENNFQLKLF